MAVPNTPTTTLTQGADGTMIVRLEFADEEAFYGWLERSRKGSPIVRLEQRLDEGTAIRVESRAGAQRDAFSATVKQVFRSGADLWGTLLDAVTDPSGAEPAETVPGGPERVAPSPLPSPGAVEATPGAPSEDVATEAATGSPGTREQAKAGKEKPRSEMHGGSTLFEIKKLNPNQRMMLATRANRQQRQILLRDTSNAIQMALLSNPRTEMKEVVEIAKNPQSTGGVLQRLSNDQRFATNYEIQLALVRNPQTPSPIAIRLMDLMRTADLRYLAKSPALRENVRKAALRVYLKRSP